MVLNGFHIAVFFNHHVVANLAEFVLHLFKGYPLGIVFHQCGSCRQVYDGGLNAVECIQFLLDAGRAASAHHAEYCNRLFLHFGRKVTHFCP